MRNFTFTFVAGALLWGLAGCSSTTNESTTTSTAESITPLDPSAADRTREVDKGTYEDVDSTSFLVVAASSDKFEKISGEMAQTRGSNQEVKNFAQQMITDHGQTTTEIQSLAMKRNITLPTALIPAHQRMLNHLNDSKDTRKFDERYMEEQVKAHLQAVEFFDWATKNEADAEVKAFAAKTLPALRMHLDMAKKTKDLVD